MKSQYFRCFVAGSTISDGRTITPEMIDQIVETFNAETYTPRINVEHMKGYSPEPPFNGYGSVIGVRAQDDEITIDGKKERRRALYAQVDGNAQLVKLAKADQKPFPSVELTPSYAGIDKVGLIGLAFTDSPASIATQRLQFSRSAPGTFHAHGAEAVTLEFEGAPADPAGIADAIRTGFASVAALFSRGEPEKKEEPKPKPEAANDNFAAFATAIGEQMATQLAAAIQPIADAQARFRSDVDALTRQLATTPDGTFSRAPATGGNGALLTDF
ncbi:GPO family capsid scaffolding protein [Sphingomonas sp. NPDC079357]|uniref:GPO family capsid scaffolding protein n=1 Tax=Sphingomonas sp. NPDC079357 TaxID=3364518 RepID=UPI00384F226A